MSVTLEQEKLLFNNRKAMTVTFPHFVWPSNQSGPQIGVGVTVAKRPTALEAGTKGGQSASEP